MIFASLVSRIAKTVAIASIAIAAVAPAAQAASANFAISGTGSGTLDGKSFSDTEFLIELFGDDSNYSNYGRGENFNPLDKAQVTIGSLGTAIFEIETRIGYNFGNNAVFFGQATGGDLFDFFVDSTAVSSLKDDFVPQVGTKVFALNQFNNIATSLGALSFDTSGDVLFSGNAGVPAPQTSAVPLPMSGMMLLGGLAAPIALRMRRKS
ncbi:hypothetical protein G5B39_12190 [Rhodobacteraceae bacterium SC52]|nr:hypothetical protein G5B39_12190 [Rhodobacteraceae bacterium SC52]